MHSKNKSTVANFIEEIWNKNNFEKIDTYLSESFIDHSLPPTLAANKEGLKQWIIGTGKSFKHTTSIEAMVSEDKQVMLKIKMQLKHIGVWRELHATQREITTVGYRYFILDKGKIVEHWGLIDGNSIENQLKECHHGCKLQE